jgi:hypothetical protein
MAYVAYHKQTTVTLKAKYGISTQHFASQGAARGAITRLASKGKIVAADYDVVRADEFSKIEKQETRINLMSKQPFQQSVNTPLCCDPSSETYWSM